MLPAFSCKQFAKCNEYNGRCECPAGFGGDDCSEPGMQNNQSGLLYFFLTIRQYAAA